MSNLVMKQGKLKTLAEYWIQFWTAAILVRSFVRSRSMCVTTMIRDYTYSEALSTQPSGIYCLWPASDTDLFNSMRAAAAKKKRVHVCVHRGSPKLQNLNGRFDFETIFWKGRHQGYTFSYCQSHGTSHLKQVRHP